MFPDIHIRTHRNIEQNFLWIINDETYFTFYGIPHPRQQLVMVLESLNQSNVIQQKQLGQFLNGIQQIMMLQQKKAQTELIILLLVLNLLIRH